MKTPFTPYKQWLSQHDAGIKEEYPDRRKTWPPG